MKYNRDKTIQIGSIAKPNGYKLADVKMMVIMACRSSDYEGALDYILAEVTKKTSASEIIMKLVRELPDDVIEFWDEDVAGKREDWGKNDKK